MSGFTGSSSHLSSRLFEDMIDCDLTGLYCPDFTLTRRHDTHTTRKTFGYNMYEEPVLEISRPACDWNMIPITEIDDLLSIDSITKSDKKDISLGKRKLFTDVKECLDMFATEMHRTYNHCTNMETLTYTVPVIGFFKTSDDLSNINNSFGCHSEYFKKIVISKQTTEQSDNAPRERFIIIHNDKYSIFKTYKRHGTRFVALNIPSNYDFNLSHYLAENEQTYRIAKTSVRTDITITLPAETELSGLSIHPEKMQFEMVHSTNIRCHNNCVKSKHCISCLKNDPGFIINFKLMMRSSNTYGQWISLGTFSGNCSMFDSTRITFDKMLIKELRIVPLNYHNSFDKIRLFPIGPTINMTTESNDMFVSYSLHIPRDGNYVRPGDHLSEKNYQKNNCDCSVCLGRRSGKGQYKEKCRFLREVCDY
jgi:hypothetical protein